MLPMITILCYLCVLLGTATVVETAFTLAAKGTGSLRQETKHRVIADSSSAAAAAAAGTQRTTTTSLASIDTYGYNDWKLTYRYKAAKRLDVPTLLLIHPVGIGLNSWFWTRLLQVWPGEVLAPDLIGCGLENGGDPWIPSEKGLSFPLGWVQGCEALMTMMMKRKGKVTTKTTTRTSSENTENKPLKQQSEQERTGWFASLFFNQNTPTLDLPFGGNKWRRSQYVVVAQGGLAPVGVMLASRNPERVSNLVLTSPPTWKDMTTGIPEKELKFNYDFLSSPVLGKLAFNVLESRWVIEFFSNAFLFEQYCDEEWLDLACNNVDEFSRPPVMAFNAGLCNHRSFEEEMTALSQPTLILCGGADKRYDARVDYIENMPDCTMETLPGLNVLPWESPQEVCQAILNFLS